MKFHYCDGGRSDAAYKGAANDCVTRAIAIATGLPYREVYDGMNLAGRKERRTKRRNKKRSTARDGVFKPTYRKFLESLGWQWIPTMRIGSGCTVHLRDDELPMGILIVSVSRHLTCVINGTIFDTHDPSRKGTRCVYGYWLQAGSDAGRVRPRSP